MMSFRSLVLTGSTVGLALLAFGQSSPVDQFERGLRPHLRQQFISGGDGNLPVAKVFDLGQARYAATISQTALALAPEWKPSMPLPIDLAKLESIARKELRKLVADDSKWEVTDFHLQAFHGPLAKCWFFQVGMKPLASPVSNTRPADSFWVFVDLAGEPGTVEERK